VKTDKTDRMKELEKERKEEIADILRESYEKYGLLGSASDLGVSPQTLYRWYAMLGIQREVKRVAR